MAYFAIADAFLKAMTAFLAEAEALMAALMALFLAAAFFNEVADGFFNSFL
jgi:hypothetical protein